MDQPDEDRINEFEGVVRVLNQRMRQIGDVDLGVLEIGIACFPFTPATQAEDGEAGQDDETRRPERKARLSEFSARSHQACSISAQTSHFGLNGLLQHPRGLCASGWNNPRQWTELLIELTRLASGVGFARRFLPYSSSVKPTRSVTW